MVLRLCFFLSSRGDVLSAPYGLFEVSYCTRSEKKTNKERKKTDNPKEGWEDGTPPPHRDFLRRGECGASRRPPLGVCLFLSLFAVCRRFSLPHLYAAPRSSYPRRSRSCRFFLCRAALLCLVLQRHRRLSVPCSHGFSCLSAQFCSPRCVLWPLKFIQLTSRENDSSDAHSYHLPTRHVAPPTVLY